MLYCLFVQAHEISIISAAVDLHNVNPELGWSDDEEDVLVDNLVKSIEDCFFSNSHFTGEVSKADVTIMREEAKKESLSRKPLKAKLKQPVAESFDDDYFARIVKDSLSADMHIMGEQINNLGVVFSTSQNLM